MKSFDDWIRDFQPANPVEIKESVIDDYILELMEFNGADSESELDEESLYPCASCCNMHKIECNPVNFDPYMHYCGKTQWCLP